MCGALTHCGGGSYGLECGLLPGITRLAHRDGSMGRAALGRWCGPREGRADGLWALPPLPAAFVPAAELRLSRAQPKLLNPLEQVLHRGGSGTWLVLCRAGLTPELAPPGYGRWLHRPFPCTWRLAEGCWRCERGHSCSLRFLPRVISFPATRRCLSRGSGRLLCCSAAGGGCTDPAQSRHLGRMRGAGSSGCVGSRPLPWVGAAAPALGECLACPKHCRCLDLGCAASAPSFSSDSHEDPGASSSPLRWLSPASFKDRI